MPIPKHSRQSILTKTDGHCPKLPEYVIAPFRMLIKDEEDQKGLLTWLVVAVLKDAGHMTANHKGWLQVAKELRDNARNRSKAQWIRKRP